MAELGKPTVRLNIDGTDVETGEGRLLIDVAEEHDIFVPRFCYHPGMESVAVCRMCLVQIEGSRRPLEPACVTRVADGMVVHTNSEQAREAQEAVLELLLINHPLDCPICDRGGECPLQDQALRFGPAQTRYREEKRHYPKPLPISKLVTLDRERCVLCWRCVRFAEEIAGDPFIDLMDRGSLTQINTGEQAPFDSHFSGNTIQICPVGALTSSSYRFLSRPWDLQQTQSVCSFCSVGCPISVEERGGQILRTQALPNDEVNSFWNCDKGRWGHRYVSHPDRLTSPLLRKEGSGGLEFAEVSWQAALDTVASKLNEVIQTTGPRAVGAIGGSHSTNEDLYAASRFFREVVGTSNIDFRTFDAAFPYESFVEAGLTGSTATIADLDEAKAIVWFGPDPKEELPVLYLRLRKAALSGSRLFVVNPRRISLCSFGTHVPLGPFPAREISEFFGALCGESGDHGISEDLVGGIRESLSEGRVVICAGQQFVGTDHSAAVEGILSLLASFPRALLLLCGPNSNSQGALDMGVIPVEAGGANGFSTVEMLAAAAEGRLDFLWLFGADIVSDFPDSSLAEAALAGGAFIVVSELFPTDTARSANVVFPAASFAEKEGSFTNLERRIQKVNPAVAAPGAARADWHAFKEVATRLGRDLAWSSAADIAAEIAERVETHAGYSWSQIEPPPLPPSRAGTRPGANSWPLSWELRAVDASRRRGWISDRKVDSSTQTRVESRSIAAVSRSSKRPAPAEASREYPLFLMVSRALYDEGQMVSRSEDLRGVTPQPFVEIHPDEALARGLVAGHEVRVSSRQSAVRVRLRVSENTPMGAAYMLFDQPGIRSNALIDMGQEATFVEVSP